MQQPSIISVDIYCRRARSQCRRDARNGCPYDVRCRTSCFIHSKIQLL